MMADKQLSQLNKLIILVAATMAAQYALQGWLTAGKSPDTLKDWFWIADAVIWSARALVEAFVLFYLFSTPGNSRLLTFFEVALIVLIVVTLGPVLAATGQGQTMSKVLPGGWYWAWSFAVASYAPLMIAAAGFAYRVRQAGAHDETPTPENVHADETAVPEPVHNGVLSVPEGYTKAEAIVYVSEQDGTLTHQQIADIVDTQRPYVSKVLKNGKN